MQPRLVQGENVIHPTTHNKRSIVTGVAIFDQWSQQAEKEKEAVLSFWDSVVYVSIKYDRQNPRLLLPFKFQQISNVIRGGDGFI